MFTLPDFSRLEAADVAFWQTWRRRHGVAGAVRLADDLRRQALLACPDWPSPEERQADLAMHIRLSASLRRVAPRQR